MKLTYIFLFMNVVATLAYDEDCYSEERKIRRLEKTLTKISTKYNGEYELEFVNWGTWLLDPVNLLTRSNN